MPVGYKLELWKNSDRTGTKLVFEGQEYADGSLVCQDLGVLSKNFLYSEYSINLHWTLNNFRQQISNNEQEIYSLE